jgi:hypothetical protein
VGEAADFGAAGFAAPAPAPAPAAGAAAAAAVPLVPACGS